MSEVINENRLKRAKNAVIGRSKVKDKVESLKPEIGALKRNTTALVLSGGAARGAYEMGVWQALRELGIKIDLVCGTSIGAMNAYIVAQDRFEDALKMWVSLSTEDVFDLDNIVENRGVKFTGLTERIRKDFPEENVRSSPVDFGLCTVKLTDDKKINLETVKPLYLWKDSIPQGEMLDYVLASCACYPVVKPYEIDGDKYLDGGFFDYIPIRMALERGAERIIAVNLEAVGVVQEEDLALAKDRLTLITPSWELGSFVVFDQANTRRIIRLGYLDAMKALGIFDGSKFAFAKGSMDHRSLSSAERAGKLFDLDCSLIYTEESFKKSIAAEIEKCRQIEQEGFKAVESELEKLMSGGLKWKKLKETLEETGDYGMQRAFLHACSKLADPGASDIVKTGWRKVLKDDLGAALWMIKNGLV